MSRYFMRVNSLGIADACARPTARDFASERCVHRPLDGSRICGLPCDRFIDGDRGRRHVFRACLRWTIRQRNRGHAFTLPASWYNSEAVFRRERATIFRRNWSLFTWSQRIAKPGDYVRGQLAGCNVFVIRGDDGVVRAFHNVCRHRGAELIAKVRPLRQADRLSVSCLDLRSRRAPCPRLRL